jgi:hypothetical protein
MSSAAASSIELYIDTWYGHGRYAVIGRVIAARIAWPEAHHVPPFRVRRKGGPKSRSMNLLWEPLMIDERPLVMLRLLRLSYV